MVPAHEQEAEAEQSRRSPTVDAPVPQTSKQDRPCQNKPCVEEREQKAILKGLLSKRDSELRDIKQDFRDFAKNNSQEVEGKEGATQLRLRAETAEEQCKDLVEERNIQNQRIRQLERQVAKLTGAEQQPKPSNWTNKRAYVEDGNSDYEENEEKRATKKARQ